MTTIDANILAALIVSNGGVTAHVVDPDDFDPPVFVVQTSGYVVASKLSNERAIVLDIYAHDVTPEVSQAVHEYVRDFPAALGEPGHYLGAWIREDGALVLDVSEVVVPPVTPLPNRLGSFAATVQRGYADGFVAGICRERGEDAAFHLDTGRTIYADGRITS